MGTDAGQPTRDFLKPMNIRNNFFMAYDISATYNLEQEVDVAPTKSESLQHLMKS